MIFWIVTLPQLSLSHQIVSRLAWYQKL